MRAIPKRPSAKGSSPKRPSAKRRAFSKAEAAEFYRRLAASRPIPKTELEFINPFTLLVAVVLSAQATDVGVNKATPALFAIADTPQKMLGLGEERLTEMIRTIGLFRTKARNIIALSQMLIEQHGGTVPRDREALEKLPGVGRKTANVVLNVAFGEPQCLALPGAAVADAEGEIEQRDVEPEEAADRPGADRYEADADGDADDAQQPHQHVKAVRRQAAMG